MALDPADFLAQAPLLVDAGGEAGYRSAINRAYYACHLMARDRLFGLDAAQWGGTGRRPSHRAVIRVLRGRPSMRDAARSLEHLRQTREVADYIRDDAHPEAQSAVQSARRVRLARSGANLLSCAPATCSPPCKASAPANPADASRNVSRRRVAV